MCIQTYEPNADADRGMLNRYMPYHSVSAPDES